jgi:hypothetical protein
VTYRRGVHLEDAADNFAAPMLRAKSVRWPMKWPRQSSESSDLGSKRS